MFLPQGIRRIRTSHSFGVFNPICNKYFQSEPLTEIIGTVTHYSTQSNKNQGNYDIVVVGGGIVGAATARELIIRHPNLKLAVTEKEDKLAAHQSGHNSGVIHAGIYYTPGSLKAKLCVEGLELAYEYCDEHCIPYKKCGKLIVAVDESEIPRLDALWERGQKNNVKDLKMVDSEGIREIEPNCRGKKALWSPHTGIVDWAQVTRSYGEDFKKRGGQIWLGNEVTGFRLGQDAEFPLTIVGTRKEICCRYAVTCGGLHSDKLSEMSGCSSEPKIVPFRGEYLLLKPEKRDLVRGNIYPVPDPRFPFLGVHFTPRMDGSVWLGPNAVLAFKREGYKLLDVNAAEMWDALKYSGLRQLAFKHFTYGIQEMYKGIIISAQVRQLQRFVPQLQVSDVTRGPSGVRAQALDSNGNLVDDFVFDQGSSPMSSRVLHVRNAPSPGATSSLAIAKMIADKIEGTFTL